MDSRLTRNQLQAARMIAMGVGYQEIASELSVDRTTVYRWRKDPRFSAQVSRLVEAVSEQNRDQVVTDIDEINFIALSTLIDVAKHDSSGSARVAAARALSDLTQRAEDRFDQNDVMRDQSSEIRSMLQLIHEERR